MSSFDRFNALTCFHSVLFGAIGTVSKQQRAAHLRAGKSAPCSIAHASVSLAAGGLSFLGFPFSASKRRSDGYGRPGSSFAYVGSLWFVLPSWFRLVEGTPSSLKSSSLIYTLSRLWTLLHCCTWSIAKKYHVRPPFIVNPRQTS